VSEARRLLARFPGYTLAQVDLASALLAQEDAAGAGVVLTEARALRPDDPRLARWPLRAARSGDRDTARGALATLDALARTRYVTPVDRAIVRLGLGERDAALGALEAARDERDTWVPWLRCWPLFDELRGRPASTPSPPSRAQQRLNGCRSVSGGASLRHRAVRSGRDERVVDAAGDHRSSR
jgi:hypothetical protein